MKRQFNRVILIFFVPINMIIAQEKSVLIIDAGHGGIDLGAVGTNKLKEKNITLTIAKAMLEINSTILNDQYDIYMTRYADTFISLSHRTKLARALQPDLFRSIHCNNHFDVLAVNSESCFGENVQTSKINERFTSDDFMFHQGFIDGLGLSLNENHIINQIIYLDDKQKWRKLLDKKIEELNKSSNFGTQNKVILKKIEHIQNQINNDDLSLIHI